MFINSNKVVYTTSKNVTSFWHYWGSIIEGCRYLKRLIQHSIGCRYAEGVHCYTSICFPFHFVLISYYKDCFFQLFDRDQKFLAFRGTLDEFFASSPVLLAQWMANSSYGAEIFQTNFNNVWCYKRLYNIGTLIHLLYISKSPKSVKSVVSASIIGS